VIAFASPRYASHKGEFVIEFVFFRVIPRKFDLRARIRIDPCAEAVTRLQLASHLL
jgi:hypothetical protein